jgi:hypothetical protein
LEKKDKPKTGAVNRAAGLKGMNLSCNPHCNHLF